MYYICDMEKNSTIVFRVSRTLKERALLHGKASTIANRALLMYVKKLEWEKSIQDNAARSRKEISKYTKQTKK